MNLQMNEEVAKKRSRRAKLEDFCTPHRIIPHENDRTKSVTLARNYVKEHKVLEAIIFVERPKKHDRFYWDGREMHDAAIYKKNPQLYVNNQKLKERSKNR